MEAQTGIPLLHTTICSQMSSKGKLWAEDTGSLYRDTPVLSSPAYMLLEGQSLGIRGDSKPEALRQLLGSPGGSY